MRKPVCVVLLTLASIFFGTVYGQVNARMLRQPDVSASEIAFVYAGDIWVVPKAGGAAERLSSPEGEEQFPRFSPDGSRIAYSANYDGNTDIYVVSHRGGLPKRVTHHPMPDRILDWYPDGTSLLIAAWMESGRQRFRQLFKLDSQGGLPERLPVAFGEFGSISPDGSLLAYMPKSRDYRTWKRYRGGMAPDIWLFNLETLDSENITKSDANDAHPMWHGNTLYFLSDRGSNKRHNIWAYERNRRAMRQVTHFKDFDVHFPAIGPAEIVFEAAGQLYLLNLSNEKLKQVIISVVTDERTLKPRTEKVAKLIRSAAISPTGKRALFEARGEIFSVPAEHGVIRNLSRDSGVAQRFPSWSPDGKRVVYWSDQTGEYELTARKPDGTGEEETLTSLGEGFKYEPYWSPDSKKVAFIDQEMRIRILDLDTRTIIDVDRGKWLFHGGLLGFRVGWSADSRWLAYPRGTDTRARAIFVYDVKNGERHQLTSGYYDDSSPSFDPDGKYLYFLTSRKFTPSYSDFDNSFIYSNSTQIAAVALRADVPSPLAPRNDEEPVKEEESNADKDQDKEKEGGNKQPEPDEKPGAAATGEAAASQDEKASDKKDAAKKKEPKPVEIDLEGIERRIVILPPAAGNYRELEAVSGKVVYRRLPRTGAPQGAKSVLAYFDLKERKEQQVVEGINGYTISADDKKVLVVQKGAFAIIDLKPKQQIKKKLRTAELESVIDPRAEWRQIFNDAWRLERDYFYDRAMHGVDWNSMRQQYGKLIDDAVTRWDVNYVLGELIGELNASHTYRGGGDAETPPSRGVGMLGVNWEVDQGHYRIKHIVRAAAWDTDVRSPLDEPGVDVKEGQYILAVNGIPLDVSADPWAAFQGLNGKTVSLTVNDQPSLEGSRDVLVKTLSSEGRLRHLEWIEKNRRRVDEASGGQIGYVYVRSTGIDGQSELVRQFYAQFEKKGLIIDERFNSGGQIPDRFIEVLNRKPLSFWAVRDGKDWQWPPVAHFGPKVMLINGWSGSGGDAFPYYFKEAGLGPLIGSATWGGLIGISGAPGLVDGGFLTVPTFRMYSTRGQWFAEGRGVSPDIEVVEDPTEMAKGKDPQLERAIQEVIRLIEANPPMNPRRPAYENRSK